MSCAWPEVYRFEAFVQVRARMQTLKERLFDHVTEVLECDREPQLPAASKGWRNTWEKAVRFLKRENESPTDSQLQERLQELHEDIHSQISTEVCARALTALHLLTFPTYTSFTSNWLSIWDCRSDAIDLTTRRQVSDSAQIGMREVELAFAVFN